MNASIMNVVRYEHTNECGLLCERLSWIWSVMNKAVMNVVCNETGL